MSCAKPQALMMRIQQALRGIEYGSVQLVIHEGEVVRIERIERTRLAVIPEAANNNIGRLTTSTEARHDA